MATALQNFDIKIEENKKKSYSLEIYFQDDKSFWTLALGKYKI